MIRRFWRVMVVCLLVLSVPLASAPRKTLLTILHTNDTHSTLFSFGPMDSWGGIARMSAKIKELKQDSLNTLVLNSGDVFVGTFEFNKFLGFPELKIMESLYDAMCLGNHEFDLGLDALLGVLSGQIAGGDPVGLPILCANVNLEASPALKSFVKPYIVKQVGGIKVGLIGVVNTDALNYSPEVFALLTDPFQAAGQAAYALRNVEGAEIVICLSHLGKMYDIAGLSQVPGIDVIVGGHSHDALTKPIVANGKIIVQAGEFGRYLGKLVIEKGSSGVRLVSDRLYPIDWWVPRDPALYSTLNFLKDGIDRKSVV